MLITRVEDRGVATLKTTTHTPLQKRYSDFLKLYKAVEPELREIARHQPMLAKRPTPASPSEPPNAEACASGCGWCLGVPMLAAQRWECPHGCHTGVEFNMIELAFPPKGTPAPFASASTKAQKREKRREGLEKFLRAALAGCNGGWCTAAAAQGDRLANGLNAATSSSGLSAASRTIVVEFMGCGDTTPPGHQRTPSGTLLSPQRPLR